jgi:predicted small metal-binding protein
MIVLCIKEMKKLACRDIGLDCGYIIEGEREEDIIKNAKQHIWEVHAIKQEEITSEMKAKITQNISDS